MKKVLFYFAILLTGVLLFIPILSAKPVGNYKKVDGSCHPYPNIPGFCIQAGVDYNSSKTYYNCNVGLSCYEAAAAYYGMVYNDDYYWGAQTILNGKTFYSNSSCTNDYSAAVNQVSSWATNYCLEPSFNSTTINMKAGTTETFTDDYGVISNYTLSYNSSAFTASKTSDGIKITAISPISNATIVIKKGSTNAIQGFCSDESQNYIKAIAAPYVEKIITINIEEEEIVQTPKYGDLIITKVNTDGNPLIGVKFKVGTNLNGVEGTEWNYKFTNATGEIEINDIPVGTTYYYEEIETLENYQLDKTRYSTYVASETIYNKILTNSLMDKGTIRIVKKNQYNNLLGNIKFKIGTNLNGIENADWKYYWTDEYGEININDLSPNTYYVKEIEAIDNYIIDENIYTITLNDDSLYETLTLTNNLTINRFLKVIKRDSETYESIPNVKINIYKSDGTIYAEEITNESGEISIIDIEDGSYYLQEIEAAEGYKLISEPYEFEINDTHPTVTIELFNDFVSPKTGREHIVIPFTIAAVLLVGTYLIIKRKQKLI